MINLLQKSTKTKLAAYESDVILKYQTYNGLFLGLPFADPDQAGPRLPIFTRICVDFMNEGLTVPEAVEKYLSIVPVSDKNKLPLLKRFLQFVERQVVLFDALEDAAFAKINDMSGYGTIDYMLQKIENKPAQFSEQLQELLANYKTRLVLTAHPTQFYPSIVLAIIKQLCKAIKTNDLDKIRDLFLQMGLTSFSNKIKPTPNDEAQSIIWYLENIFYSVVPHVQTKLSKDTSNLDIGFWPGGDRDGNPYVTAKVTLETADKLRNSLMRLYYQDIKNLSQTLTFAGVYDTLVSICHQIKQDTYRTHHELLAELQEIANTVMTQYQGLFIEQINEVILKVKLFKFHFAKIDIRQNSAIHKQVVHNIFANNNITQNYQNLTATEKVTLLVTQWNNLTINLDNNDELTNEVIDTIKAIATIQKLNGKPAIERYIISNTDSVNSILEVLWLVTLVNNTLAEIDKIQIEIVPLFETIDDLQNSTTIMEELFNLPCYQNNLQQLNNQQTIMLGFSDGTKDGGYLMANWMIFQAKKRLSILAKQYLIDVAFFDGRGGPPSRGGGETYSFYQGLAQEIEAHEIQLTIQGQTISANFGTNSSAIYNIEHLLSAGISGRLFTQDTSPLSTEQETLIDRLAQSALHNYLALRNDPLFVEYVQEITPLNYLTQAKIGSRPAKRSNKDAKLKLEDLRAIPFGGAWMQMKQNILGYYGFGSAIAEYINSTHDGLVTLQQLYQSSLFFKGLIDNSMQSLASSNFTITKHLANDIKFGGFWQKLYDEAELSKIVLRQVSQSEHLIANNPVKALSMNYREQIIMPLLFIQQYAMAKLRTLGQADAEFATYESLITKSLATNINASRNSI